MEGVERAYTRHATKPRLKNPLASIPRDDTMESAKDELDKADPTMGTPAKLLDQHVNIKVFEFPGRLKPNNDKIKEITIGKPRPHDPKSYMLVVLVCMEG